MIILFAIPLVELALAFLTFDLFLRYIPLAAEKLVSALRRYRLLYAVIAMINCLLVLWVPWTRKLPWPLVATATLVPWWLIWRFGLRKQFTFLYKADGGLPLHIYNPEP